ncbi:protein suppressor of npr1-1 [Pyrus ussuriensis x Pyrus communis]|uniref:Protein suppressor of npr1-1 n=1 Tax=Pyrus ussuriensis x Pyrus communis TaxID=2448454 RepID=A0A5N5FI39_9ROSA|nr:protein suppressor of npr1-1 [Pyrus ussuriensis x Pyrus communis]
MISITLQENYNQSLHTIVCPGSEIPNWFNDHNEGSSIDIKLPSKWFRKGFLGFALSVVAFADCLVQWAGVVWMQRPLHSLLPAGYVQQTSWQSVGEIRIDAMSEDPQVEGDKGGNETEANGSDEPEARGSDESEADK